MKRRSAKQKAKDVEFICDSVSEKHRLKLKYASKFDKEIEEIKKKKLKYLGDKNKELDQLVSDMCMELNIKESYIKTLLKSE
jgi:hypothetical protein